MLLGMRNIRRRPYRSLCLVLAALIASYAVIVGLTVKASLNNGITRMQERLGADLMIVPEDSEIQARNVLLTGEPEFFYMDRTIAQIAADTDGVESVTTQFYFTSLSSDCCSTRVQLIAFDPESDFVIVPWIDERITDGIENGQVIIGSEVTALSDGNVKFYGSEYEVAGKLGETATGLDSSVFMSRETMRQILSDAKSKGYQFLNPEEDEGLVSSILIRVREGADLTQIEKTIYNNTDGIRIIETDGLIDDVSVRLGSINGIINGALTVLPIISFITMILFFSVIFHERKKEFAILRILGTTSKNISRIALTEGVIIGTAGGTLGLIFGVLTIYPFNRYIDNSLSVPYLMPQVPLVILFGTAGVLTVVVLCAAAAFVPTRRLARAETYYTMRDGE